MVFFFFFLHCGSHLTEHIAQAGPGGSVGYLVD